MINKYVYEEVDNLAEREGVCFDNLLFSYKIVLYRGNQREERRLCIMNNGDVYAFEWTNELTPWDWYYEGTEKMNDNELHHRGYNEANWGEMEHVVYLGRFSNGAVRRLNSYVENFDVNGKYFYLNPPQVEVPQGDGSQQEKNNMDEKDGKVEWRAYGARLYIVKEWFSSIEWCRMNPAGFMTDGLRCVSMVINQRYLF